MADGKEGPGKGQHGPEEADYEFVLGITDDGRTLFDFCGMRLDHMKLTLEQTKDLRDSLDENIRQIEADFGTGGSILRVKRLH